MIKYCKLFLPGGTIIAKKPSVDSEWEAWKDHIQNLAIGMEQKVKIFLSGRVTGQEKRNRPISVHVSPTYKRIVQEEKLQASANSTLHCIILPLQFPSVVDLAWIN
jgi:ATP-dependent protease Clp ATPase subunit